MADQNTSLPVRTEADEDVVVGVAGDALTALQLIDDIVHVDDAAFTAGTDKGTVMMGVATSDSVDAGDKGALAMDTDRNLKVSLEVDNVGIGGGTEYTEDVATANPIVGKAIMIERDDALSTVTPIEGDNIGLRGTAEGALWTQDFNSDAILADTTTIAAVDFATETTLDAIKTAVEILDNIVAGSEAQVDVITLPDVTQSTHDNLNANVNIQVADTDVSEANPVPVYVTGAVATNEVNDYDTAAGVAAAGTDNHDYTVTASSTLLLKQILASASGKMKVELQVGPVASLVSKAVFFNSTSHPDIEVTFAQPIEVPDTSTGTVRIIRTNREASAQDVYSTIIGSEV